MILEPLAAHAICAALVGVDQAARALRLRFLGGALGHPVRLRDAATINLVGDAACAVTPMRLGGEPVRLAALLHFGFPATASFIAIALEVITMWPVIIICGVAMGVWLAPGWVEQTAPALLEGLARSWLWFAVAVVVSLGIWSVVRRSVHVTARVTRRPWRRTRVYWRRMPRGPVVASALLGFVNLATRTAILPVLMATLPDAPPLGPSILGSFALLYSQLALPTPAGAGVVDLGLLAGAAGSPGGEGVTLLFWWRFYTTFVGVAVGGWLAVRVFGVRAIAATWKGKGKEART
jgi:uncharacterized membrane protein YbhN (UPF0104 family)